AMQTESPRYISQEDPQAARDSCSMYGIFFFNDTATTEIYTLSLHDALPISGPDKIIIKFVDKNNVPFNPNTGEDRKSTRLNSSHTVISYAVFCLKKKRS